MGRCVALFIAAIGKCGQFPLHTWLPDAMAGPTPVSALLHSSTMVVAGVYLVARLYPVFFQGFQIGHTSVNLIALIGGITIIIAAVLAFVQVDIKQVLAYSTCQPARLHDDGPRRRRLDRRPCSTSSPTPSSRLPLPGCRVGQPLRFHHSFDMKKDMGGLWQKMPITFVDVHHLLRGARRRAPLAGFFSKDEIIDNAGTTATRRS